MRCVACPLDRHTQECAAAASSSSLWAPLHSLLRSCLVSLLSRRRALRLAVFLTHFGDVAYGLRVRRHVSVFRHGLLAGVVGRNRQPIVLKRILQELQITDAGLDILLRIEAVASRQTAARWRASTASAPAPLSGKRRTDCSCSPLESRNPPATDSRRNFLAASATRPRTSASMPAGHGFGATSSAPACRCESPPSPPNRASARGQLRAAGSPAAARFPKTAAPRTSSKQNRILLFYPIITGFLPSASFSFRSGPHGDANAIILSCKPPGLCWRAGEAGAWARTKRCCPIAEQPWWSTLRE